MCDPEIERIETQAWIQKVVVGLNFCPFASREVRLGGIHYEVLSQPLQHETFLAECQRLDDQAAISTSFLILPPLSFDDYLGVVEQAQTWLEAANYEGIYQLASFHPDYRFANSARNDAANYTNRSPHPMLHLLREEAVTAALQNYPEAESIPENNITNARHHGLKYMQALLQSCQTRIED